MDNTSKRLIIYFDEDENGKTVDVLINGEDVKLLAKNIELLKELAKKGE